MRVRRGAGWVGGAGLPPRAWEEADPDPKDAYGPCRTAAGGGKGARWMKEVEVESGLGEAV